jgi:hypothetical protein
MSLIESIKQMAIVLDSQGRGENRILVRATRRYLIAHFKPRARGGQLYAGNHPIEIVGASDPSEPLNYLLWKDGRGG